MADGGCGGGCAEWQPIYDRVRSQAEALAADRARPEAASKVQRESWDAARRLQRSVEELQAAARQKDAEIGRLRAEAAGASKKLQEARQVGASRRMRWEAACVELLLGANQKLAELRDGDMEDSRICAETPNSKEVESCAKLSQSTMDQACVASDLGTELRKLKQSYVTLSSKKDQEVSALLSEKELARNQLVVMQKDYDALLRNKKGETAQATEAAQKLQQSVDDLKVLAEKKDDEIGRLRAEAVAAEKTLQKMQSLVKEKDDEIERLKGRHSESIEKRNKDTSQMHKKSRLDDPTATGRGKPSGSLREMVEENYSFETETVEKNGQDETSQKCRRVSSSSISNDDEESGGDADDDEQNGSYEDDNEQSGSDEDGDEQSRSNEDADEQTRSDDDDGQSRSDEHDEDEDEQSERDLEMTNNRVQKLVRNPKRKRGKNHTESNEAVRTQWYWHDRAPAPLYSRKVQIINGQHSVLCTGNWAQFVRDVKACLADQPKKPKDFVRFLCNFENWRIKDVAQTMAVLLDGHPKLQRRFNRFLPHNCQIEVDKEEEEEHHPDDQLRIYQRRDRGRPILRGVPRARGRLPRDQSQGAGTAAQAVPPRLASETARSISGICNPICTFRDPVSFKQGGGGESGQGCCSGTGTHVVDGAREPQQRDTLRVTNGAVDRGNAPADAL